MPDRPGGRAVRADPGGGRAAARGRRLAKRAADRERVCASAWTPPACPPGHRRAQAPARELPRRDRGRARHRTHARAGACAAPRRASAAASYRVRPTRRALRAELDHGSAGAAARGATPCAGPAAAAARAADRAPVSRAPARSVRSSCTAPAVASSVMSDGGRPRRATAGPEAYGRSVRRVAAFRWTADGGSPSALLAGTGYRVKRRQVPAGAVLAATPRAARPRSRSVTQQLDAPRAVSAALPAPRPGLSKHRTAAPRSAARTGTPRSPSSPSSPSPSVGVAVAVGAQRRSCESLTCSEPRRSRPTTATHSSSTSRQAFGVRMS